MPRRRRTGARQLTWRQEEELLFAWGGQCTHDIGQGRCQGIGCWSAFDSEEEREEAWFAHRDRLMYQLNPGTRPAAFWMIDAPHVCRHVPRCPLPGGSFLECEAWLEAHKLLTPREIAAKCKREAESASKPHDHEGV